MQSSLICGYMQAQITHSHSSAHNYACYLLCKQLHTFIRCSTAGHTWLPKRKLFWESVNHLLYYLQLNSIKLISLNMQLKLFSVLYNCNLHVFFCIILNFIKLDITLGKPNTNASFKSIVSSGVLLHLWWHCGARGRGAGWTQAFKLANAHRHSNERGYSFTQSETITCRQKALIHANPGKLYSHMHVHTDTSKH